MKRTRKYWLGGVILFCLLGVMSCGFSNRTYKGKVIDFETKEPIVGAVVVIYWNNARSTIAGNSTWLRDVKETLTDRNGEWTLTGPKGRESDPFPHLTLLGLYYTRQPEFIIFKPGYCPWPKPFSIKACDSMEPRRTEGIAKGETIVLPRLSQKEDRWKALLGPVRTTDEKRAEEILIKQKKFIKLLDQESKYLGLPEYRYKFLEDKNNEK